MNTFLDSDSARNNALTPGGLSAGFQHALDRKYTGLCAAARKEWERCHTSADPSDACVSVRVSGFSSPRNLLSSAR